jgi:hypothetical protein
MRKTHNIYADLLKGFKSGSVYIAREDWLNSKLIMIYEQQFYMNMVGMYGIKSFT